MRTKWIPTEWVPVHFDSFDDVPIHHQPVELTDMEILTCFNSDGVAYFHKPSTGQYWIQIGYEVDKHGRLHCPTDRCNAQCCREGKPWPDVYPIHGQLVPCPFLTEENRCGIQGSKFICCVQAPDPSNSMNSLDKCEIRCVEVKRA